MKEECLNDEFATIQAINEKLIAMPLPKKGEAEKSLVSQLYDMVLSLSEEQIRLSKRVTHLESLLKEKGVEI